MIFTFNLERKSLYFVMNIVFPIVFLGFLSGFVFVIPIESGEKMGYSVTVFLSMVVFLAVIESYIPISSDNVSVLQMYVLVQIATGVLITVIASVQLRLHIRSNDIPVEGFYRKLASLREMCRCKNRDIESKSEGSEKGDHSQKKTEGMEAMSWQDIVTIIYFLCFWSFIIIYTLINSITIIILTAKS